MSNIFVTFDRNQYLYLKKREFHLHTECFILNQILGGKTNNNLRIGVK